MLLEVKTLRKGEVIDITGKIERLIKGSGIVNILAQHTTVALTISDLNHVNEADLNLALQQITAHKSLKLNDYADDFQDHLWSSILGCNLSIPYHNSKLMLGKWQRIILIELASARSRSLYVTFINSSN